MVRKSLACSPIFKTAFKSPLFHFVSAAPRLCSHPCLCPQILKFPVPVPVRGPLYRCPPLLQTSQNVHNKLYFGCRIGCRIGQYWAFLAQANIPIVILVILQAESAMPASFSSFRRTFWQAGWSSTNRIGAMLRHFRRNRF